MHEDDTLEILELFHKHMKPNQDNICFMDMRGPQILNPKDAETFDFLIFGGILGDHPPQDRAKDMREQFSNVRQLGTIQMTTDTALLVSREIMEEGRSFETL